MKKIVSVLMVMALLFVFTACSNQSNENEITQNTTAPVTKDSTSKDNTQSDNGKVLVVYFSASGNTKAVAEYIADTTNGALFELVPKNAYTDDDLNWRDENSRVNFEHDNESARNIELASVSVDNWDEYDTVFIGYPIWWGIASWVVDGFVKSNDFTGKTVIPFCTSSSSGLGQSGELLKEMAGTGNWLEGKRFNERVSQADVEDWVNRLDY